MSAENVALVRSSYDASARGDIDGLLGVLAPDARWTETAGFPTGGTYVGPAEVRERVFGALAAEWHDFACTPDAYYDAGDTVVVTGHYSGTHRVTGRAMRARTCHIWTVSDGRAVGFEQFADTLLVHDATRPTEPEEQA